MPLPKRLGGHDESTQSLLNRAYDKALNVIRFMAFGTSTGSDAVAFKTDTDGHLQIDVLSSTGASATIVNNIKASAIYNVNQKVSVIAGPTLTKSDDSVTSSLSAGANIVGKVSAFQRALAKATDNVGVSLSAGANIVGKISAFQRALAKATDNVSASLSAGSNIVGKISAFQVGTTSSDTLRTDGAAVSASDKGVPVWGKSGTGSAQFFTVDDDGHLQIDVLTGGGGGTLKNDGEAYSATDTGIFIAGRSTTGSAQFLGVDDDGHAQVDVLTSANSKVSAIQVVNAKVSAIMDLALAKATDNVSAALSAGANIVGKASAFQIRPWYSNGGYVTQDQSATALQVSAVSFNHAASGSAAVVALAAGKVIRVIGIDMTVAASGAVGWKTNATVLMQPQYFPKNSGKEQNYFPGYMVQSVSGSALHINSNAAITARGTLSVIKI